MKSLERRGAYDGEREASNRLRCASIACRIIGTVANWSESSENNGVGEHAIIGNFISAGIEEMKTD